MARVYADVNQNMPRSYWDYDGVNISGLPLPLVSLPDPDPSRVMRELIQILYRLGRSREL